MPRNHTATSSQHRSRRRQNNRLDHDTSATAISDNQMPKSDDNKNQLELSVHMPSIPTSNRFELLATEPAPSPEQDVAEQPAQEITPRRRFRSSRGSKISKRRRDARRKNNRAVQMLDEQLSRDIDDVLAQAIATNNRPSSPTVNPEPPLQNTPQMTSPRIHALTEALRRVTATKTPRLEPVKPTSVSTPSKTGMAPPQLPAFDFPDFKFDPFADFWKYTHTPPKPTSPFKPTIPSWCPPLPAFSHERIQSQGMPIFFDLSCLPEPKCKPEPPVKSQEMQLWQNIPKKQSRFFPVSGPNVRRLKEAPTACRLSDMDESIIDMTPALPENIDCSEKTHIYEEETPPSYHAISTSEESHPDENIDCTPARLWNILEDHGSIPEHYQVDPYPRGFSPPYYGDMYSTVLRCPQDAITSIEPVELDSTEIPYVHSNSLTGVSNDLAISPYVEDHPTVVDSGVFMQEFGEPLVGLNELLVDLDMGDQFLPEAIPLPPSPAPSTEGTIDDELPLLSNILPVGVLDNDSAEDVFVNSDAHFNNTQELFSLPSPPLTEPEATTPADVADPNHEEDCCCPDCEDMEVIYPYRKVEEDDEWIYAEPDNWWDSSDEVITAPAPSEEDACSVNEHSNTPEEEYEAKWIEYCEDGHGLTRDLEAESDWEWEL